MKYLMLILFLFILPITSFSAPTNKAVLVSVDGSNNVSYFGTSGNPVHVILSGGGGSGTVSSGTINQEAVYTGTTTVGSGSITDIGNIGIGSKTPGQMLDVQGTIRSLGVISGGTNYNFVVDSAGNVAIGTNATGSTLLTLGSGGSAGSYSGTGITKLSNTTVSLTNSTLEGSSTIVTIGNLNNGSSSHVNFIGGTEVLPWVNFVSPTNVGINSVTPGYALDVQGTTRITGGNHFLSSSPTPPTVAINACGSTSQGTIVTGSTDITGTVVVGTLTVTSCTITFANAYKVAPNCVANDDTNVLAIKPTETINGITFTSLSSASGDSITWICIGNE